MEKDISVLQETINILNFRFEALQKITQLINLASNFEQVLDEVMRLTIKLVNAQAGVIILIDQTTGELSSHVTIGGRPREESGEEPTWKLNKGVMGAILKVGEPAIISDASEYPIFRDEISKAIGCTVVNALCVPLKRKGGTLGVLEVFNKRLSADEPKEGDKGTAPFTAEDQKLIVSLSNEIVMVIDNAMLFSERERKVVELDSLLKATEAIASAMQLDPLLDMIMELGMNVMDAEGCSVLLVNEKEKKLQFVAASGAKKEEVKKLSLDMGEGVAGWVAQNDQSLLIEDVSKETRFSKKVDESLGQKTKSLICVPLKVKQRTIGVMEVINKKGDRTFNERDMVLFKPLSAQAAVAIERARLYEDLEDMYISTVKSLAAAIDAKDPYTRGHSERVTRFSMLIAKELGLDDKTQRNVQLCALLHDVGKIGVPISILRKKDKLTDEDWKHIRRHPVLGAEIISPITQLKELILSIRHHHERYDGKGYPDSLKGEDIPLISRILAVADTFDALTSERPYRSGLRDKAALEEMMAVKGTQLDPACVEAFLAGYGREFVIREE
ncbi:GAF domain-containing protein [bacterium]|nr:GAF domain-containing protein [bacterium]NIN91606.1 GAF domain-containing protein [bacterium]NIO17970.1 GAF domain-containing protein [bacterium]NIO73738.1 GAF domain-containing protein [bacterium]